LQEEARLEAEAVAAKRAEMERRETELALELEQIEKQLEETRTIAVKASEKPIVIPPPIQRLVNVVVPPCHFNGFQFQQFYIIILM
jgi:predicted Holliday junction resolvase-like endonuclease